MLILAGLVSTLGPSPASAQTQEASAATLDWIARACTADTAFDIRFGDRAAEPRYRLLDDARQPFPRLTLSSTERSGRLFRVETVGMFRLEPGSTRSDAAAGRRLFEAIDGRITQLGAFSSRERVIDEDGDIDITYSHPTARPDSRVVLEVSFMLGGVWVTCKDQDLFEQHVEEVLR